MTDTTLLLLVQGDPITRVLLGYKKTGFGKGKYTGIGGKVEPGETVVAATVREMAEETGVAVLAHDLKPAGHIAFYFPAKPAWNLAVHIFLAHHWQGVPQEGREVRPQWFAPNRLPFHTMWADAVHWYPLVLAGQTIRAAFTFNADNETIANHTIQTA